MTLKGTDLDNRQKLCPFFVTCSSENVAKIPIDSLDIHKNCHKMSLLALCAFYFLTLTLSSSMDSEQIVS